MSFLPEFLAGLLAKGKEDAESGQNESSPRNIALSLAGYNGGWKLGSLTLIPCHNQRLKALPPDTISAFETEVSELSDAYLANLQAIAKRHLGDAVLTEEEARTIVDATVAAAKANAPGASVPNGETPSTST